MADTVGTATLVLDADLSRFLVEMAKAHASMEKTTEHAKETGKHMHGFAEMARDAGRELMTLAIPLTSAGALIEGAKAGFEAWNERLRTTKEILDSIVKTHQGIAASGKPIGPYSKALDEGGAGLNEDQKLGFYRGYIGPRGNMDATAEQVGAGAGVARKAAAIGRDVAQFGELYGGAEAAGLSNPGDVANYLMRNVGDGADKAMEVMSKNPAQGTEIAEMFALGTRGGRGTRALIQKLSAEYIRRGSKGSFRDFIASNGRRIAGAEGQADLHLLLSREAPHIVPGQLDADYKEIEDQPRTGALVGAEEIDNMSKTVAADVTGGDSVAQAQVKARAGLYDSTFSNPLSKLWNAIRHPGAHAAAVMARAAADPWSKGGVHLPDGVQAADLYDDALRTRLPQLKQSLGDKNPLLLELQKQTGHLERAGDRATIKRLRPTSHGEQSP